MIASKKNTGKNLKTAHLNLGSGWTSLVSLTDSSGRILSLTDWSNCLSNPESLLQNCQKLLKHQGPVALKTLTIGESELRLVVKNQPFQLGLRALFRSLRPAKALQNFKTAAKLIELSVPVVLPLAALQKKIFTFVTQSIYITEYVDDSTNLYEFVLKQLPRKSTLHFAIKKQLSNQIASILASLHKSGFWHRDSKAGNFLVSPDGRGNHRLVLVDMDGIKRCHLSRRSCRLRSLWRLAASLIGLVNRTDYLRTLKTYCNLIGLDWATGRRLYRILAAHASQKWLSAQPKKAAITGSFTNILIIKPSSLGDIVLALPALTTLRKSFPDANISWLVRPAFSSLLDNHPHLDRIILFDRKFLGKAWYNPRAFLSLVKLIIQLRQSKFDAVFDFQGLLRTALLSWLTGCKNRFGMTEAREFAHLFCNHRIPLCSRSIHLVDYYRKIIRAAGGDTDMAEFLMPFNSDAEQQVSQLLKEHNINADNYVVLVPGSAHADKAWPFQNYAELAQKIFSDFHSFIITVGTVLEKPLTERLKSLAAVPVADFAGLTTIPQLITLLRRAKLVVTNDTGPGHIAAALGVPLVMIFGPSNPARVAPYARPDTVVALDADCRGIEIRSNAPRYRIEAITVDQVYQKIRDQLHQQAHAHDKTA